MQPCLQLRLLRPLAGSRVDEGIETAAQDEHAGWWGGLFPSHWAMSETLTAQARGVTPLVCCICESRKRRPHTCAARST